MVPRKTIPNAPRRALLLGCGFFATSLGLAGCVQESPSGPQPKNRKQAARLNAKGPKAPAPKPPWARATRPPKEGTQNAPPTTPNAPGPSSTPAHRPLAGKQVGRHQWLLGPPMQLQEFTRLSDVLNQPEAHRGRSIKIVGSARPLGQGVLLHSEEGSLWARLPQKAPGLTAGKVVLEGKLVLDPEKAAQVSPEGLPSHKPLVTLIASSAIITVK